MQVEFEKKGMFETYVCTFKSNVIDVTHIFGGLILMLLLMYLI